jgi:hypothetical protein
MMIEGGEALPFERCWASWRERKRAEDVRG